MQGKGFFTQRKAAVAICIALLMITELVCARPLASQMQTSSEHNVKAKEENPTHTLRRVARMTPLWRIMNSKPSGAFCQNNFECSTGLCRAGHCSTNPRSSSEPVKY